jgi:hypothetical protein
MIQVLCPRRPGDISLREAGHETRVRFIVCVAFSRCCEQCEAIASDFKEASRGSTVIGWEPA